MMAQVLEALGGLGLFLMGMVVLTDGLRAVAGNSVQRLIQRFTKTPTSGAATGAVLTAVLQSSSVTTVTTVAFVGAGVLTFAQALGVMFGANIGTTAKGWLFALLGFEYEIDQVVLPLLLVGVLLHLFGKGRMAHAGWALAGFAVLFLGLDVMQGAMSGLEGVLTPTDLPPDTRVGRLLLLLIGFAITLVTQSSSAGVAAALAAVATGTISFPQAAAMVIGMDVGTTSTTALATIGGSTQTRRTGYAHVVYNVLTGVGAYFLLDLYVPVVDRLFDGLIERAPHIALVGFHTTFNVLGVVIVLPFTRPFARLMTRLVPERGPDLTARLDTNLLGDPAAATLALAGALRDASRELFAAIRRALDPRRAPEVKPEPLARVAQALEAARAYAGRISGSKDHDPARRSLLDLMHVIDHLERLVDRCRLRERIETVHKDAALRELARPLAAALRVASARPREDAPTGEQELLEAREGLLARREPMRRKVLGRVPGGKLTLDEALERLDALRWLSRVSYHAWRIAVNLEAAQHPSPVEGAPAETEEEDDD